MDCNTAKAIITPTMNSIVVRKRILEGDNTVTESSVELRSGEETGSLGSEICSSTNSFP
jgi:hypothetical protein